MTGSDAWQTPGSRQALAQVAEADAGLAHAVRESQRADRRMRESPDFPQRLRAIEDYARSRAAPRALRALQERIDAGDLSWRDLAEGRRLDDPVVRAALAADVYEPPPEDDEPEEQRGYAFLRFDPDAAE